MCALLSVRSSWRQQGAPFQFTHQPQRRGVKARGITVGDFTFEGQDYQSGDPCEEVMREGGSGGGRGRRGGREGRATRCHPGIRGALFSGERICRAAHLFDTRRCGVRRSGAVWAPSRLFPVLVNREGWGGAWMAAGNTHRTVLFTTEGAEQQMNPLCLLFSVRAAPQTRFNILKRRENKASSEKSSRKVIAAVSCRPCSLSLRLRGSQVHHGCSRGPEACWRGGGTFQRV